MDVLTTTEAGAIVVAVRGEVDADNCHELAAAFSSIEVTEERVVVDARHLTFIDSSGISTLLTARGAIQDAGARFEVREPTEPVRRVLEITGLLELLNVD